jgi:hypothetical protein
VVLGASFDLSSSARSSSAILKALVGAKLEGARCDAVATRPGKAAKLRIEIPIGATQQLARVLTAAVKYRFTAGCDGFTAEHGASAGASSGRDCCGVGICPRGRRGGTK